MGCCRIACFRVHARSFADSFSVTLSRMRTIKFLAHSACASRAPLWPTEYQGCRPITRPDVHGTGGTMTYSCSSNADSGTGNILDDPKFRRPATHDWRINSLSPCARRGENKTYMGCFAPYPASTALIVR